MTAFGYQIKRSKRKTIGLYVIDGELEVRAPRYCTLGEIDSFVVEQQDWVENKLEESAKKASEKPVLEDGGTFLFLGKQRQLRYETGSPDVYELGDDIIISRDLFTDIERLFEEWLISEARLYITDRIFELADTMDCADLITDVAFRKTKSKWGHCTEKGKLQFNWLIIMAPPVVIDYVIIHELAHLFHLDHSKAFWAKVAEYCKDHKEHRRWLNDNGHKLWFT